MSGKRKPATCHGIRSETGTYRQLSYFIRKTEICLLELWCDCLGKDRSDMKRRDAFELEAILNQIGGWSVYNGNTTGKKRLPDYGIQKTFVRTFTQNGGD